MLTGGLRAKVFTGSLRAKVFTGGLRAKVLTGGLLAEVFKGYFPAEELQACLVFTMSWVGIPATTSGSQIHFWEISVDRHLSYGVHA